jgi:N-methylhydantoinase A
MQRSYQVDVRYHGQGLRLTVDIKLDDLRKRGLAAISGPFDDEHRRLFTFALPLEHEFVALRAVVQGKGIRLNSLQIERGGPDPKAAAVGTQKCYMDGKDVKAVVYDRSRLKAGNRLRGPSIVMEMDSTTVILPKHTGIVDRLGNILIYPDAHKALAVRGKPAVRRKAATRPAARRGPKGRK